MNLSISKPVQILSNSSRDRALRTVIFQVFEHLFAIPVGAVEKIVVCPPITNKISRGIGIVSLDSQTVTVVDLRYKFERDFSAASLELSSRQFLILIHTESGESCGILVASPPFLKDLPISSIQPIPVSYREVMDIELVNYMAILTDEGKGARNIFILGMERILIS